jgi:hypothetical protein
VDDNDVWIRHLGEVLTRSTRLLPRLAPRTPTARLGRRLGVPVRGGWLRRVARIAAQARLKIYDARLHSVVELNYLSQLRLQGGVLLAQKTVCVAQDIVRATQCLECGADINR